MFGQTFDANDLLVIGILIVLEGVLSIDNALVLGLLARRLPKFLQSKALTYGLIGAFVFRLIAIGTASYLLHWRIAKLLGGLYLVWVAMKHFFWDAKLAEDVKITVDEKGLPVVEGHEHDPSVQDEPLDRAPLGASLRHIDYAHISSTHTQAFWMTVGVIELTDVAFAIDSIVAAIGVVGPPPPGQRHPKLWVVLIGGMLGVILMRFAAVIFIRLLEKFPRFETSAYLLVIVIGMKLVLDYVVNTAHHPDRLDFHSPDALAFWIFWIVMIVCFCIGFIPHTPSTPVDEAGHA
jgi:YkoY family integral membrane protein